MHVRFSHFGAALFIALCACATGAGAQEWRRACSEGETCEIDGVRLIRYGADGNFSYGVATNQLICTNDTFGDPAPRREKGCWYLETDLEQRLSASLQEREEELESIRRDLERIEGERAALREELNDAYAELDTIYRRLGPGQVRRLERAIRRNRERGDRNR